MTEGGKPDGDAAARKTASMPVADSPLAPCAARLPLALAGYVDQLDWHLDADGRRPMAAGGCAQRGGAGLVGAGCDHPSDDAARPTRRRPGRLFDRRWLLITVQTYLFVVGILLAGLTAIGQMPPALLLAFTFALGAGGALQPRPGRPRCPNSCPGTSFERRPRLTW